MDELGTLGELPPDYLDALRGENLVPLWPSLRSLLPPERPKTATQPTHWRWSAIRPLLLRAGSLTPIEKAERRVLVLANPGRGLDNLQASSAATRRTPRAWWSRAAARAPSSAARSAAWSTATWC
jgi:gentisate 1,2-dioxygenase